jgi:hypothetical protein
MGGSQTEDDKETRAYPAAWTIVTEIWTGGIGLDPSSDSNACRCAGRHKAWYDGRGRSQIWRLLERQKSQQKNPASSVEPRPVVTVVIDKH